MRKSFLLSLVLLLTANLSRAQHTLGLLSADFAQAFEGYTLIYPFAQPNTYLLDNCGEVVHTWTDTLPWVSGPAFRLASNGNLYVCKTRNAVSNPGLHAGGGGEKIEIRDWDNNLIWTWTWNDATHRMHHDFKIMPNGNVLITAWEKIDSVTAVNAGRNPARITQGSVWPDELIEVQPVGADSGNIVWRWKAWDHLVQNFDNTKPNYGDPAQHPERIDLNFGPTDGDWHHFNAIDFHPTLNQIAISVPTFNEIWIIDHSTTTAEAASHSGGLAGRGGDILYRWGNPMAYGQGDSTDIKLGYQHDVHWILDEAAATDPDRGKIMVFNNRIGGNYSAVNILNPTFDTYNWEYPMTGQTWGPANPDFIYTAPVPTDFYSFIISNAQKQPNGNLLVLEGVEGYIFELNPALEKVWEYKIPFNNGVAQPQGTILNPTANMSFRALRYPVTYPAFTGRTLSSTGWLELNPDSSFCDSLRAINRQEPLAGSLDVWPNPAQEQVQVRWENAGPHTLSLVNAQGQTLFTRSFTGQELTLDLNAYPAGLYFLRTEGGLTRKLVLQD